MKIAFKSTGTYIACITTVHTVQKCMDAATIISHLHMYNLLLQRCKDVATIISHLNVYNASEVYGCGNDYFTSECVQCFRGVWMLQRLFHIWMCTILQRCMDAATIISHLNVYNASEVYGCCNDYFTSECVQCFRGVWMRQRLFHIWMCTMLQRCIRVLQRLFHIWMCTMLQRCMDAATIISHLNVYNASEVYMCCNDYFTSECVQCFRGVWMLKRLFHIWMCTMLQRCIRVLQRLFHIWMCTMLQRCMDAATIISHLLMICIILCTIYIFRGVWMLQQLFNICIIYIQCTGAYLPPRKNPQHN